MTIFNRSKMDLDTSVRIKPIKIQHEAVEGKYGLQDQWYVKIDGEDATTYTGYTDGEKDWHGEMLVSAMEQGIELILQKGFNKKTNRPKYGYKPNVDQSTAQTQKSSQNGSQAPKTASTEHILPRKDTKSITIGMLACMKVAGEMLDNPAPEKVVSTAARLYELNEIHAILYRPDITAIKAQMIRTDVPADFWDWLCAANKVADKESLPEVATAYTLTHWDKVIERYANSEQIEQTVRKDQEDNWSEVDDGRDAGNIEFERKMEAAPGPMETTFPAEGIEEECPW